jgi:hypothetical protein
MGPSLDPDRDAADERRQALLDRARLTQSRAAEALAVSAALAEGHAERAEAAGDVERAEYERKMARRAWATVERIRGRLPPGAD